MVFINLLLVAAQTVESALIDLVNNLFDCLSQRKWAKEESGSTITVWTVRPISF